MDYVLGHSTSELDRLDLQGQRSPLSLGLGGMDEQALDSLEDRLRDEAVAAGTSYVLWPVVTAWCCKAM